MATQRAGELVFVREQRCPWQLEARSSLLAVLKGECGDTTAFGVCQGVLPARHVAGTS
jgi:hypothetical protein